jgi:hypothetical protein
VSHHFDTDAAKDNPQLNICDMYLFDAGPGRTTMALTVNADAGLSSPDTFHPEGIYAFHFDTGGDTKANLTLKVRFGEPTHADGDEHRHVQAYQVIAAHSREPGLGGVSVLSGQTGVAAEANGYRAFAGLVPELWAADALAFQMALVGVLTEDRFHIRAFENRRNTFSARNATAIVLEVPNALLGSEPVRMWGTVSLVGHAPEVQVSRYGLPLFTHMFLANPTTPGLTERYHASDPTTDRIAFRPAVHALATRILRASGTVNDPATAADAIADRFCPDMMPYTPGSEASFTQDRFNGRRLTDDAYDVVWSLVAGQPIADGVAPDAGRTRSEFPYFGRSYDSVEQAGLVPIVSQIGYNPNAKAPPGRDSGTPV